MTVDGGITRSLQRCDVHAGSRRRHFAKRTAGRHRPAARHSLLKCAVAAMIALSAVQVPSAPCFDAGSQGWVGALKYDLSAGRRIAYRLLREVRSAPKSVADSGPSDGAERVFSEETMLDLLVARRGGDGVAEITAMRRTVRLAMPDIERFPAGETAPVRRDAITASVRRAAEDYLSRTAENWRMDELGRIETKGEGGTAAIEVARRAHRAARWKRRTVDDLAAAWRDTAAISPSLPIWPVFPEGGCRPGVTVKYRGPMRMTAGGIVPKVADGGSGVLEIEAEWTPGPVETGDRTNRSLISGPMRMVPRISEERFHIPLSSGQATGRVTACEALPGRLVWDLAEGWPDLVEGGFRATVEYLMGSARLSRILTVRVKVERVRQAQ